MILTRLYDEKLAQASYLFGCGRTGEALVIDPNRDAAQYLTAAERAGLKITAVTETHIHADFASGARELAHRTGATLYLSDEGDADWKYGYAQSARAVLVRHGDRFQVGNVRAEVLHTPGHTPEHVSFLITDTATTEAPMGIATGDFVFVGDVGRPDLLEKAAKVRGNAEKAARTLFKSLQSFRELPDYLQVWPGHGAGSACGKGLSPVPQSTVGYEKLFNWAFQIADEDEFVRQVLEGQPEPPRYFAEMKRLNKQGPPILERFETPAQLAPEQLAALLANRVPVVDVRPAIEFAAGHIPGTINIPYNKAFTGWAGWLLPYDREFYFILDDRSQRLLEDLVRDLAMIGLDRTAGYFGLEVLHWWSRGASLGVIPQATPEAVATNGNLVVDVRSASEWATGHIPEAIHVPLGTIPDRFQEIPRDRPIVVQCQSGSRSAIAASLLLAYGFDSVSDMGAGLTGWQAAGLPVERD